MQPKGFNNSNIIIGNVMNLIRRAILDKAFIVIAQFKKCGETHDHITAELNTYPYKVYLWHNKNDKSKPIKEILIERGILVRQLKVCGVNTEYCIKDTVNGLAKKFNIPIKVIEEACNGTDLGVANAIYKMRTAYSMVEVL
jgi:nicotinamidase-related amidase